MDADRIVASSLWTPPDTLKPGLVLPPNVNAGLAAIRTAEGTNAPEGWRALYGWRPGHDDRLFRDTSVHPRIRFWIRSGDPWQPGEPEGNDEITTAAGAFQENWPTWSDFLESRRKLGLPPPAFDEAGQTACAVWLIKTRAHAWDDLVAGDLESALGKCAPIWASLPHSTAGQPTKPYALLEQAYLLNGGALA